MQDFVIRSHTMEGVLFDVVGRNEVLIKWL